jgi:hypothetical protein
MVAPLPNPPHEGEGAGYEWEQISTRGREPEISGGGHHEGEGAGDRTGWPPLPPQK